jgi:hypothetical protein
MLLPVMFTDPVQWLDIPELSPDEGPSEWPCSRSIRAEPRDFANVFRLRPMESGFAPALVPGALAKTLAFPHFFPQLWKTRGETLQPPAGEATVTHGPKHGNRLETACSD